MPRVEETVDSLRDAVWFSKIDSRNGYWQVSIKKSDKQKTAFRTHNRLYEFNKMLFGLCNAPCTFQRVMNNIFNKFGWKYSMVYVDDVIIYSSNFEKHVEHVEKNSLEIRKYLLKINYKKSKFNKIEYFGFEIEKNKVKIFSEIIKAILYYPIPTTKLKVQQFLGLCGYYRIFIFDFAKKVRPLNDLLKKKKLLHGMINILSRLMILKNI